MANEEAQLFWIPGFMRVRGTKAPITEADKAAWEVERQKAIVRARKEAEEICGKAAQATAAVPFFGPAAAAIAYPICIENAKRPFEDSSVFGPVPGAEIAAAKAEKARGAPMPPEFRLDMTSKEKTAFRNATSRWERAYSLWKEADFRTQVPDMTKAHWRTLSVDQQKMWIGRFFQLVDATNQIHNPTWLRIVLLDRAHQLVSQMKEIAPGVVLPTPKAPADKPFGDVAPVLSKRVWNWLKQNPVPSGIGALLVAAAAAVALQKKTARR